MNVSFDHLIEHEQIVRDDTSPGVVLKPISDFDIEVDGNRITHFTIEPDGIIRAYYGVFSDWFAFMNTKQQMFTLFMTLDC